MVFLVCLGRRLTCAGPKACTVVEQNANLPSCCWLTTQLSSASHDLSEHIQDIVNKIQAWTARPIANPKNWNSKTPNGKFSGSSTNMLCWYLDVGVSLLLTTLKTHVLGLATYVIETSVDIWLLYPSCSINSVKVLPHRYVFFQMLHVFYVLMFLIMSLSFLIIKPMLSYAARIISFTTLHTKHPNPPNNKKTTTPLWSVPPETETPWHLRHFGRLSPGSTSMSSWARQATDVWKRRRHIWAPISIAAPRWQFRSVSPGKVKNW